MHLFFGLHKYLLHLVEEISYLIFWLLIYWYDLIYIQLKDMDDVDMLTLVIQEMSKEFPTLMETLVHERDQ